MNSYIVINDSFNVFADICYYKKFDISSKIRYYTTGGSFSIFFTSDLLIIFIIFIKGMNILLFYCITYNKT